MEGIRVVAGGYGKVLGYGMEGIRVVAGGYGKVLGYGMEGIRVVAGGYGKVSIDGNMRDRLMLAQIC